MCICYTVAADCILAEAYKAFSEAMNSKPIHTDGILTHYGQDEMVAIFQ